METGYSQCQRTYVTEGAFYIKIKPAAINTKILNMSIPGIKTIVNYLHARLNICC